MLLPRPIVGWLSLWLGMLSTPVTAAGQDGLAEARALYNAGQFEEAIAAAEASRADRLDDAAAALVIARSRLEHYRVSGDDAELTAARDELRRLDPSALEPPARVEWQIGVAETLFFDGHPGAAAELFGGLHDETSGLDARDRERVLEWWATAMERHADSRPDGERAAAYRKVLDRMDVEIARHPLSRIAAYWLAAAARGAGEVERAWSAAVAAWIRAGGLEEGTALRADLDRLVLQTIIPERARLRSGRPLSARETIAEMATMAQEWEEVTARWTPGSED